MAQVLDDLEDEVPFALCDFCSNCSGKQMIKFPALMQDIPWRKCKADMSPQYADIQNCSQFVPAVAIPAKRLDYKSPPM